MKDQLKIIQAWLQTVWSENDQRNVYETFIPKGRILGFNMEWIQSWQVTDYHEALLNLITDINISIDNYIEQEDKISMICTLTAKQKRDKNIEVKMRGSAFFTKNKGILIDAVILWNFIDLYEQLGLLPFNTILRAVSESNLCYSEIFDEKWIKASEKGYCDLIGGMEYHRVKQDWFDAGMPENISEFIHNLGFSSS